ncbi:MAG: H(+)-transporting two-sector ATPase [Candidatus Parvarchaeum acidophilus ARMAN-5]|jgi:vacuolar-type H+-ATPase subunit C/Vma6|uniref:H(+)-transporting two-sector ATPase n=1 Tax=Candidatus Parvarchaeum acidophilus ARMAN-5 TaxID=662762 RepID=D6GVY7_PARA5|nr:MAG: H(+)-transporting two-sector ATPase [Candidatus Parvarchaeum acidophilus ARMAN-5]EFD92606.1 MAG: H(+)-transporting two-sector ATPase [Candidatus Parvarchaeum acidophilus ARMAN-5]
MDSTYAGAYGHVKALYLDLLKRDEIDRIKESKKDEFISTLSSTSYKNEIDLFYNEFKEPDIVDIAVNTHFIKNCDNVIKLLPTVGKSIIRGYLSKIDIQNIKLILAAKLVGKDLDFTENMLIVNRGFPVGFSSSLINKEAYANIISQKDIVEVINYLTRYPYGKVLLPFSVSAELSKDVSGMSMSLDIEYYEDLLKSFKFYSGNEGPVLRFFQELIDLRNIMTVIKEIELKKPSASLLIKGGSLSIDRLSEMTKMNITDFIKNLPYDLEEAYQIYKEDGLIANFEVELKRQIHDKYLPIFRANSLSIASALSFIISSEIERDIIRLNWFKKYYGLEKKVLDIGYGI